MDLFRVFIEMLYIPFQTMVTWVKGVSDSSSSRRIQEHSLIFCYDVVASFIETPMLHTPPLFHHMTMTIVEDLDNI